MATSAAASGSRGRNLPVLERLETRELLSLLGVSLELPVLTYNSTGLIAYTADADTLEVDATPISFRLSAASRPLRIVGPSVFQVHVRVDGQGNLVGGADGPDLLITGQLDVDGDGTIDYSGDLLTGEVLQFGWQNSSVDDYFDFRFVATGGALAGYFAGKDIGVTLTSEVSNFTGDWEADFDGTHAKGNVGPTAPLARAEVSGYVYVDVNDDGVFQSYESPIPGVQVTLTGQDLLGRPVQQTTQTDASGFYQFNNLLPGNYALAETQPSWLDDGQDTIGSQGGTTGNDQFTDVLLAGGDSGIDNNFGELAQPVGANQTATIGFWHNKNGQRLLRSFNGGPDSTALGDWLAGNWPNLFGQLGGQSNAQIADYFLNVFKTTDGQKLQCQIMAVAFNVYATSYGLSGGIGQDYGFAVDMAGLGYATWNVGDSGEAFDVADGTQLTVLSLLTLADAYAVDGVPYAGSVELASGANDVFDGINNAGDRDSGGTSKTVSQPTGKKVKTVSTVDEIDCLLLAPGKGKAKK